MSTKNLLIKTKYYLLLLVLATNTNSQTTHSFRSTKPEIDMKSFSKDQFSDWTPNDFEAFRKDVIEYDQLVKELVLEEMFPEFKPNLCDGQPCKTYMYDITNHNLGEQHVASRPTLLLIGGLHGSETIGVQGLMRFIKLAQRLYNQDPEIFQMLNNSRLLIIPAINMSAFYRQMFHEPVPWNGGEKNVNPNFDFNLNPKEYCYVSLTAVYLQRLYQEFLIFGSLVYTKGNFEIKIPRVDLVMGVEALNVDKTFYNTLSSSMALVFNYSMIKDSEDSDEFEENLFSTEKGQIPELEKNNSIEEKVRLGETFFGSYIEWASGASEERSSVRTDCLPNESPYANLNLVPSNISNRAIALEIQLDKAKLKDVENPFGNEIACVDINHPDAEFGVIAGVFYITKKFVQSIIPYVNVNSIDVVTEEVDGEITQKMEFVFFLYAPITVIHSKMNHKDIDSQTSKLVQNNSEKLFSKILTITAVFKGDNILKEEKNYDLSFSLDLERQYVKRQNRNPRVLSHYLKIAFDPQHKETLGKFNLTFPDTRNYTLKNFQINKLESLLIRELYGNFSRFFSYRSLLVQMGSFFPFQISYDSSSGLIKYQKIDSNIPKGRARIKSDNHLFELGLFNSVFDANSNQMLFDKLSLLNDELTDLEAFVYNDENTYFCKYLQTKGFHEMIDEGHLDAQKNEILQKQAVLIKPKTASEIAKENQIKIKSQVGNTEGAQNKPGSKSNASPNSLINNDLKTSSSITSQSNSKNSPNMNYAQEIKNRDKMNNLQSSQRPQNLQNSKDTLKSVRPLEEETQKYKHMYEYCGRFFKENKDWDFKKSLFLELNKNMKVLPSIFLNLVGHKLDLSFSTKVHEQGNGKLLDKGTNETKRTSLVGSIILPDPEVTGKINRDKTSKHPPIEEILQLTYKKTLPFPKHKVTCSTFSPIFEITSANLEKAAIKRFEAGQDHEDFNFLLIQDMVEDTSSVQVFYYTSAKDPPQSYILQSKNKSFEINKKPKASLRVAQREGKTTELQVYRGMFPKDDLRIEGMFVMVFKKGEDLPVFDCFLGSSYANITKDAINLFKIYMSILKEMDDAVEEHFGDDVFSPNKKKSSIFMIVDVLILLIFILGGMGAYYYFFVYLKREGQKQQSTQSRDKAESKEEVSV